jgi:pyrroline-5-carboxylate reductase
MSKIGFIGYGSMGSLIINELLSSNALKQGEIIISNRTTNKLSDIKKEYPEIEITENNLNLADKCHIIFLFVSTSAVKDVIKEMKPYLSKNSHIIYISAGLTIETVKSIFQGKVTKIIPSLTSKVHEGVSLVCHSEEVVMMNQNS